MADQTVVPYLVVDGAADAIDFYRRAFGAQEMFRMDGPDGRVAHASLSFGGSTIMLSDPFPQAPYVAPSQSGKPSSGIYLYVDDVDAVFQQAIDAGATEQMPLENMFWGDRWGRVGDPFGHVWELAQHVEDVSEEDMAARAKDAMAQMSG